MICSIHAHPGSAGTSTLGSSRPNNSRWTWRARCQQSNSLGPRPFAAQRFPISSGSSSLLPIGMEGSSLFARVDHRQVERKDGQRPYVVKGQSRLVFGTERCNVDIGQREENSCKNALA